MIMDTFSSSWEEAIAWYPLSAKQTAVQRPTYPVPTTDILILPFIVLPTVRIEWALFCFHLAQKLSDVVWTCPSSDCRAGCRSPSKYLWALLLSAADYSLLCDDLIDGNVLVFGGDFVDDLKLESQSDHWCLLLQGGEKPVIVSETVS